MSFCRPLLRQFSKLDKCFIKKQMSLWYVPVQANVPKKVSIEKILDQTFPPLRYISPFNHKLNSRWVKKVYDSLYNDIAEDIPLLSSSQNNMVSNDGFIVDLDVKHFKPEEVTIKVDGKVLEICGKHRNKNENGFEFIEFHRKYTLPDDVDLTALTSNISVDGVLHIEAPKVLPASPESIESTDENFKCSLDVQGFKPEEISIQVKGRDLVIHGETKTEDDGVQGFQHKQFTRNISLPDDVDLSHLSSRYTKDFKLTIEAPKIPLKAPLKLEIEKEE
ncbi:uncharacterized protein LOC100197458 isoform X1 [Hydra vulgaris]|uniref:uncharacterized protein LOC100197458 isoform X1 n=1 Tax=Hydra vulgaris TaxID=6087 RepID=UPI001F5E502F|nr:uncharacterized protein LOC100197458 [Hydra vulgaris]